MSYSYPLDNNGQKRIDHMGWTRDLCILNNFSNPILTSTCSHPREIEYVLASNIRVAVETRPTQLQNLLCFSGKIALQS